MIPRHMMSHDVAWYHTMSHDTTSHGVTWYHTVTWCHMIPHYVTWHHMIPHVTCHMILRHMASRYHTMSHDVTWYHITWRHDTTLCHMMSHDVTLCHMASHATWCLMPKQVRNNTTTLWRLRNFSSHASWAWYMDAQKSQPWHLHPVFVCLKSYLGYNLAHK